MMLTGSSHQLCRALTGLAVCSHPASGMHPPACHMRQAHPHSHSNMLNAAKNECSSVLSFSDLRRSSCIFPAAEKTRSTPPDENGAARYCLAILGHVVSFSFQYFNKSRSMSVSSGDDRYSSSSSRTGTTVGDGAAMAFLPSSEPSVTFLPPGATGLVPVWRLGQRLAGLAQVQARPWVWVWAWPQSHARGAVVISLFFRFRSKRPALNSRASSLEFARELEETIRTTVSYCQLQTKRITACYCYLALSVCYLPVNLLTC